jgi:hypothetical protein
MFKGAEERVEDRWIVAFNKTLRNLCRSLWGVRDFIHAIGYVTSNGNRYGAGAIEFLYVESLRLESNNETLGLQASFVWI